jgi:glycosyltransferase involved in cell wall biosynthesis
MQDMKNQLQERGGRKIKLCLDARMYRHSGIGRYIRYQIDLLVCDDAYELILLVPKGGIDDLKGIRQIVFRSPIYSFSEQILYPFVIPACDVFWSPHYNVPILPVKAKKRWATIHDLYHLRFAEQLGFLRKCYAKMLFSAACRLSNRIITVSQFSRNELLSFFNVDHKVEVMPNVVDKKFYENKNTEEDVQQVLRKYNINSPYILFVGNLKPHKNLITLLKAFEKIMNDFSQVNLVVAGKESGFLTEDRDTGLYLDHHPELKKRVFFTGLVADDDLPALYRAAKVFVFPSLYEGFGYPPLEALVSGTPVLCSNAGPMPEVCGDRVAYFDPLDVDQLSRMLKNQLI